MDADDLSRDAREVEGTLLDARRLRDQLVAAGRVRRGEIAFALSEATQEQLEEDADAIAAYVSAQDTFDRMDAEAVAALDDRIAFLSAFAVELRTEARRYRDG